jgi:hypothetical protein
MNRELCPHGDPLRGSAPLQLLSSSVFQNCALIFSSEFQLEGELGPSTCSQLDTHGKNRNYSAL